MMQRQTPSSCVNRGINISRSSDMARLQNTPSQNVSSMVSNQKDLARSSQDTLDRSGVSFQFMQDDFRTKEVGDNLGEMHESRYQLVCCTCLMYRPRVLVGECGCLACMGCLKVIKHRYCYNCQVSAKYIPLEKLIKVSNDGSLGNIFIDANEKGEICIKEFLSKVVKEERDFRIASKILDKQEAAMERRNCFEKKEMEKIIDEEKTLRQKIWAKYEAISKLEKALKLKHPSALMEYNHVGQERLEINGDNSYYFSGEPSVDLVVSKGFGDSKDQDHRNENIGNKQDIKTLGQKFKLADYTDKNRVHFGEVEIRNQINSTPCKDDETTPIALKSILKKKKDIFFPSHGIANQLIFTESKIVRENRLEHDKGFKASKINVLATVDERKKPTPNAAVVSKDKGADVGINMVTSHKSEDNAVVKNSKNNVDIEKAGSSSKEIKRVSESSKDEDTKRIKLNKTNGRYGKGTSKNGLLMSTSHWMDSAVKNRGDVVEGVRGNYFGEWKDGHGEAKRVCKSVKRRGGHDEEGKGPNGEGGIGCHVKKNVKFAPLPSAHYPMTKSDREIDTRKMNEKKEHNMTYDYLDAIGGSFKAPMVNMKTNEGPSFGSNKKKWKVLL